MEEYIKVKVRQFNLSDDFKVGDLVSWEGIAYKFKGWDYGTYPVVEDLETGETKNLPHY